MICKSFLIASIAFASLFAEMPQEPFLQNIHEEYLMHLAEGPINNYAAMHDYYTMLISHPLVKLEAERALKLVKEMLKEFFEEAQEICCRYPAERVSQEFETNLSPILDSFVNKDHLYTVLLIELGIYRYNFPELAKIQQIVLEYLIKGRMISDAYAKEVDYPDYIVVLREEKIRKIQSILHQSKDRFWSEEMAGDLDWLIDPEEIVKKCGYLQSIVYEEGPLENPVEEEFRQLYGRFEKNLNDLAGEYSVYIPNG